MDGSCRRRHHAPARSRLVPARAPATRRRRAWHRQSPPQQAVHQVLARMLPSQCCLMAHIPQSLLASSALWPTLDASDDGASSMCRNIRTLFNFEPPATEDEIHASALQFVRKLSGFTEPSKANEAAFNRAVDDVSKAARRLLASLETARPPRNREVEAMKAKERSRARFA